MNILKFENFINEAIELPIVDFVIDKDGNVYNGKFNNLVKGYKQITKISSKDETTKKVSSKNTITGILGANKKNYIAGVDKNGSLVTPYKNLDSNGYLIDDNGNFVKMSLDVANYLNIKDGKWSKDFDYSDLLSSDPTGWVNFKVDMEILKRVKRYSSGLGMGKKGHDSFIGKLEDLNSINYIKNQKRTIQNIQREMSIIMLLHYIEEIKDFFTPSAAGFLFESFIGGLLPNAKVVSDNTAADIVSEGKEYQIKTLDAHNLPSFEFVMKSTPEGNSFLDHYVICFKYPGRIEIYIIDGDENSKNYCGNFITSGNKSSYTKVKSSYLSPYVVDLLDIDNNIDKISNGLKSVLNVLYSQLSDFQYNVETIVSGVNKEGKLIDNEEFDRYSDLAKSNASSMRNELENLISHYKGNI
jgi:hypothetical protein